MEYYFFLIFFSILLLGVFGSRKWLVGIVLFWIAWTLIMIFAPWLMVTQFVIIALSAFFADNISIKKNEFLLSRKSKAFKEKTETFKANRHKNVHLITTESISLGALDFEHILKRKKIKIETKTKMLKKHGELGLAKAIERLRAKIGSGDIVAIVRGGGDINTKQFDVYRNKLTLNHIKSLRCEGAFCVLGVGHTTNSFPIDEVVDYKAITPTEAAFFISHIMKQ